MQMGKRFSRLESASVLGFVILRTEEFKNFFKSKMTLYFKILLITIWNKLVTQYNFQAFCFVRHIILRSEGVFSMAEVHRL